MADRVEIGLAIKDWITRSTKTNKTDIYLFFAGHGLASDNGKDMFLLPYDGSPRLLESAIRRKQLFKDIQQANPRSVTVFLDTCYSGTTRGTDMLIASRPIAIRALEQSIPSNFTVFSAAAGDQTSKPLEEAKHGMFSYFLMKGMEGNADTNQDISTHDLLEEAKLDLNTYYQLTRLNFICQLVLNLKLHNLRLFSVSNCPRAYVVLFLLKVYLPGM